MRLYKRGNVWWVRFVSGGKEYRNTTRTGDRAVAVAFLKSLKVARQMPTFKDAVEVLRILFKEKPEGVVPLEAAWSVYERIASSLGRLAISERGKQRRANTLRNFVAWCKRDRPMVKTVEDVLPPVAAAYAEALAKSGRKSKTRGNVLGELGTIWRTLEKTSAEIHNPWGALAPKNTDSERGKAFTTEEVALVLNAARKVGKDWFAVCTIALHTGLRYGDVATLKWSQIDGETLHVKPRKTERFGIVANLPIIAPVAAALAEMPKRGEYVFPLHAGWYGNRGRLSRDALSFREVLAAAGLDGRGFTFHSFRHTAATRLAGAGVSVETRKRILGHTEDATADRYDHAAHVAEVRAALEAAAK